MGSPFQQQVYDQPAMGVPGDRASFNPLFSYDVGPGGLVAGSSLFTGRFAWVTPPLDPNGTPTIANSFGSGAPSGFCMRNMQASQANFLAAFGTQILPGLECALMIAGDFVVQNDGSQQALYGMKAYADVLTGKVSFAVTGSPTTGASAATSTVAATTFSVTGSIAGNVMTVTAVGSGTIVNGGTLSGTGVATGTKVVQQLTGTPGGIGTYYVDTPNQTAASTTISGTYGLLTLGTVTGGVFGVGQQLNATGAVVAGTKVTQLLTGSGGTGSTFAVDNNTVVSSQTITVQTNVETKWFCRSAGLPGQIVKMSSTPNS
jgi:hypothetical protein